MRCSLPSQAAFSKDLVLSNMRSIGENGPMALLANQLAGATRALEAVRVQGLSGVTDRQLLELIAASAANERVARAHSAALAGELSRQSAPELGHQGLAQRSGHRTPQRLIQATTGVGAREAAAAVRVGGL